MSWGYAVGAILPNLLQIIGIQDYKGLDTNLKNKLTEFAQQLIDKWQLKQQEASYSPDSVTSSIPNKNQLQSLMYQDFANEARQLASQIQEAQVKDMQNWDHNRGWYSIQDAMDGIIKWGKDINIINKPLNIGIKALSEHFKNKGYDMKWFDDAKRWLIKTHHEINQTENKYKARNKNILQAKNKSAELVKSQKDRFDKFNNYVIQSRDRFGRNSNNNNDYKSHSDTNIKQDGTNQERIIRETKF